MPILLYNCYDAFYDLYFRIVFKSTIMLEEVGAPVMKVHPILILDPTHLIPITTEPLLPSPLTTTMLPWPPSPGII